MTRQTKNLKTKEQQDTAAPKHKTRKVAEKKTQTQPKPERRKLLEDLFYDFNASRWQIYRLNFVRGIFFGFGSVLGATILVALVVWILSSLAQVTAIPFLSDFFESLSESLSSGESQ